MGKRSSQSGEHLVLAGKNLSEHPVCSGEPLLGRYRIAPHQESCRIEITICSEKLIVGVLRLESIEQSEQIGE